MHGMHGIWMHWIPELENWLNVMLPGFNTVKKNESIRCTKRIQRDVFIKCMRLYTLCFKHLGKPEKDVIRNQYSTDHITDPNHLQALNWTLHLKLLNETLLPKMNCGSFSGHTRIAQICTRSYQHGQDSIHLSPKVSYWLPQRGTVHSCVQRNLSVIYTIYTSL